VKPCLVSSQAESLHRRLIVCDLTLPLDSDYELVDYGALFRRLVDAGYTFVSITIATDSSNIGRTMHALARHRAYFGERPEQFLIVQEAEDIRRAKQNGQLAVSFHLQGTNSLEQDLHMVEIYYDLGIRHMLLAYNLRNAVGDGCHERTDAGLSRFGVELVREMNRVGVIVDCSHTGYRTTMDAFDVAAAPVIFSHSNARALLDHERNIRDEQIRGCAATGGVIGVNGVDLFLGAHASPAEAMAHHIDYIASLVGIEHVAIGLDYVLQAAALNAILKVPSNIYPESAGYRKGVDIAGPETLPALTDCLLKRGYSDADVACALGGNFLRVAEAVWRRAGTRATAAARDESQPADVRRIAP